MSPLVVMMVTTSDHVNDHAQALVVINARTMFANLHRGE